MYVRVLHFSCRQETNRESLQRVFRLIVDEARKKDGYIGATLLMRERACRGMALMYWRDEAAASQAGPAIVTLLGEHAHDLLSDHPDVQGYNLVEGTAIPEFTDNNVG
jgi:hypothetical protein